VKERKIQLLPEGEYLNQQIRRARRAERLKLLAGLLFWAWVIVILILTARGC